MICCVPGKQGNPGCSRELIQVGGQRLLELQGQFLGGELRRLAC